MSFYSPHLLWLLVPLLLLFSWELARHTARAVTSWPKITRAWAGAFNVSLGTRHTTAENRPRLWLWFGLALGVIALARPQWGVIEERVFDQSREVLIAVDLSKSMLAQDVKPSRLDRSKLLIQSLLDGLKGERVGLVLFAGTAFLQSPLSSDYEILREFLPSMNPDYLPEGGSDYQAMLETSIQAFGTSTADRYLIILSDGESTTDDWKKLTDSLKQKSIRVISLGVGTAAGSLIPDGSGAYVKDERGAVVMSHLNSSTLQELAQVTGGAYEDASAWVDLSALLKRTIESGRKGEFSEKNTARKIERYQWFLTPALLLLCLSFWSEFPVRPRERALPLANKNQIPTSKAQPLATAALTLLWLSTLLSGLSTFAAAGSEDTFAKPLSTTVARLAEKGQLTAKDYAELSQTTLTYGQRAQSTPQPASENVIRDGLESVSRGEKLDTKAADWPKLRQDLEALLKQQEQKKDEQKKDDKQEQKQDQSKQDQKQQNQDQQNQNKDQQSDKEQNQSQDQSKQQEQESDQQQKQDQAQKQNQDAFGDMKPNESQPTPDKKSPPPQPQPGTQKVGGQTDKKSTEESKDPLLAMPLQKLDQVRNQDSPAKLQQLLQGPAQKPTTPGKDW